MKMVGCAAAPTTTRPTLATRLPTTLTATAGETLATIRTGVPSGTLPATSTVMGPSVSTSIPAVAAVTVTVQLLRSKDSAHTTPGPTGPVTAGEAEKTTPAAGLLMVNVT